MDGKGWGALSCLLSTTEDGVFATRGNESGTEKRVLGMNVRVRDGVVVAGCGCSGTRGLALVKTWI